MKIETQYRCRSCHTLYISTPLELNHQIGTKSLEEVLREMVDGEIRVKLILLHFCGGPGIGIADLAGLIRVD